MRVGRIPAVRRLRPVHRLPAAYENVTQVIAVALTLCSFAAGLFIPLSQFSPDLQTFAKFTPLYGLSQLVHYPLAGGTLEWVWILNLAVWLAIFVAGAAWRLRRDTARV